jgi:hypothetical protein
MSKKIVKDIHHCKLVIDYTIQKFILGGIYNDLGKSLS